jgi:SAM-dependent methyltransferase
VEDRPLVGRISGVYDPSVSGLPTHDSTRRFGNRVDYYVRYRPSYPPQVLTCLRDEFGLQPGQVVADVGSGTGIFSTLLLAAGHVVYAVEPNRQMRAVAEQRLGDRTAFHSVAASAEATTLPDASVDWVMAAQAFHWFEVEPVRCEFRRIVRPQDPPKPNVAFVWNNRCEDTPFLREYEALLRARATDYTALKHQYVETDGRLEQFFGAGSALRSFANRQAFDFEGLCGRTLSASYIPLPDDPRWPPLRAELQALFDRHAEGGSVAIEYDTHVYVGALR